MMRGRRRVWMCVVRVCGEVGASGEGWEGPECRERTVRDGGDVDEEVELEGRREEVGRRRGWRARKAMKGYVVAWSFSDAGRGEVS